MFLGVALFLGWLAGDRRKSPYNPSPSTYGKGPYGAGGFYELLGRLGVACGRWQEPLGSLSEERVGALVIAIPTAMPIKDDEAKAAFDWAMRGRTLVIFLSGRQMLPYSPGGFSYTGSVEQRIEEDLGLRVQWPPQSKEDRALANLGDLAGKAVPFVAVGAAVPVRANAGAPRLSVEETAPALVQAAKPRPCVPLYTRNSRLCAAEVPYGRGTVIVVSSSAVIQNAHILEEDNLTFALNLASAAGDAGGIWFDEYHQGYVSMFSLKSLARAPAFPALVILAGTAMLLFIFSKGRRFGPARPPVRHSRRHVLEYVNSVAGLYRRAENRRFAATVLFRALSRRLERSSAAVEIRSETGGRAYRGALAQRMSELSAKVHSAPLVTDDELLGIALVMEELENEALGRSTK